jgi:hypothetical protein
MANKRIWWIGGLLVLVVGLPVAWYLVSPLFINREVDEPLPTARPTAVSAALDDTQMPQATEAMATAMVAPTQSAAEPMPEDDPSTMQVLAAGSFYPVAHEGEGSATIYLLADGSRVLRFEAFDVLNGPDLHVYLVPADPVPNTVGVEIVGYVDLGELKGNIGSQNYDLPANLDLSQFKSVVIWCQPFRVPFAAAPLAAPE